MRMTAQFVYCAKAKSQKDSQGVLYSELTVTIVVHGPTTTVLLATMLQEGSMLVPSTLLSDNIQNFMLNFDLD